MTSIVNISSNKAGHIRTISRIVNIVIGLGLIFMILEHPPVKQEWIAMSGLLSIVLITFSIVGLWPKLRVSIFGHVFNNKIVHTTVNFLVGMIVIMLAVYDPPANSAWFTFFIFVGAMLVFDAIMSMGYMLKSHTSRRENTADIRLHNDHNKASKAA